VKTPELLLAAVLPELSSAAVVEEVSPVLVDAGADVTPGPVVNADRDPPEYAAQGAGIELVEDLAAA